MNELLKYYQTHGDLILDAVRKINCTNCNKCSTSGVYSTCLSCFLKAKADSLRSSFDLQFKTLKKNVDRYKQLLDTLKEHGLTNDIRFYQYQMALDEALVKMNALINPENSINDIYKLKDRQYLERFINLIVIASENFKSVKGFRKIFESQPCLEQFIKDAYKIYLEL